jgi:hypothetical protein
MAFFLFVGVDFGRRTTFVRRNKPDFTSSPSAVKRFLVRHSKNNRDPFLEIVISKIFLAKKPAFGQFSRKLTGRLL